MLITLLYHRAYPCRYGNSKETLEKHFAYLKKTFPLTLPFEHLLPRKKNVCITFDDATFDFYYIVFPLLKKYQIKAVLAVSSDLMPKSSSLTKEERLQLLKDSPSHQIPLDCYCTQEEIKEMSDSNLVQIASHGKTHQNLTLSSIDLALELQESKLKLEKLINKKVECFVYPYGRFNKKVHKEVLKHYKLGMRIGNAINFSWKNSLHYRLNADQINSIETLFQNTYLTFNIIKMLLKIIY